MSRIKRRRLILGSGAALGAPLLSFAQLPGKAWRIGFIGGVTRPDSIDSSVFGGFVEGMREFGYVEGKNLALEWRFADGRYERFATFARELVDLKVDVIVAGSTPAAHAVLKVTRSVPIVMGASGDPVLAGLVKSLAHPGGNVTGLSQNLNDLSSKYLELIKATVPGASRIGLLMNPDNQSNPPIANAFQATSQKMAMRVVHFEARSLEDIRRAFAARTRVDAAVVFADAVFMDNRKTIVEIALQNRVPLLAQQLEFGELGALMTLGQPLRELFRRAAVFVDRILKGAKPSELPVEQPNIYALVVNLKTAHALGLAVPQSILVRADRIIE